MLKHPITIILILALFQIKVTTLSLQTSTIVLPHTKTKGQLTGIYEDRSYISPNLVMVADGIGGSLFPAGPIANSIIYGIAKDFYSTNNQKVLLNNLVTSMTSGIDFFHKTVNKIDTKANDGLVLSNENTISSTTLVGMSLEGQNDNYNYNFFQIGDSLAFVFSLYTDDEGFNNYVLKFRLTEQQYSFNFPMQVCSSNTLTGTNGTEQIRGNKLKAVVNDLVLLGSDGLFDNISEAMITLLVNFITKIHIEIKNRGLQNLGSIEDRLLNDFVMFLKKDSRGLNYYQDKRYPYMKKERENIQKRKVILEQRKAEKNLRKQKKQEEESKGFNLFKSCFGLTNSKPVDKNKVVAEETIHVIEKKGVKSKPDLIYGFRDTTNYQINEERLNTYIEDLIQNLQRENNKRIFSNDNLFEIFGCNVQDYFEFTFNNDYSACIQLAIESLRFNFDVNDNFVNETSDMLAKFANKMAVFRNRDVIITPFELSALKNGKSVIGTNSKQDDIGVVAALTVAEEQNINIKQSISTVRKEIQNELSNIRELLAFSHKKKEQQIIDKERIIEQEKINKRRKEVEDLKKEIMKSLPANKQVGFKEEIAGRENIEFDVVQNETNSSINKVLNDSIKNNNMGGKGSTKMVI